MTSPLYPTFEDWWNEVENFGLRSERFHESMTQFSDTGKTVNAEVWLRAAFESARLAVDNSPPYADTVINILE
jgi:hypothetical protein